MNPFEIFFGNPAARVADLDADLVRWQVRHLDIQASVGFDGLERVVDQVEQDLLKLAPVSLDGRDVRGNGRGDVNAFVLGFLL